MLGVSVRHPDSNALVRQFPFVTLPPSAVYISDVVAVIFSQLAPQLFGFLTAELAFGINYGAVTVQWL